MSREDVERIIAAAVEEIVQGTDIELYDVEYVREHHWFLRVYLDKKNDSIDLDDCQFVSEKLNAFTDKHDPIKEHYILEVSSPGLDRVLKKEKDFIKYNGRKVDIQLFKAMNGEKQLVGILKGYTDSTFLIEIDGEEITFERSSIAQMRLHIDFNV